MFHAQAIHAMNWFKKYRKALTQPMPRNEESLTNFTPRAQQVLALARKEADRFNHNFLGTEHLLLGLIKLGQGVAVNVLQGMGIDLDTVRIAVEKEVGTGPDQKMIGNIPYTPRVKKVLALASKEAKALNNTYVGTEHILLGLLREGDGVAAKVLKNLDVDIEEARQKVLRELDPNFLPQPDNEARNLISKGTTSMEFEHDLINTSMRYDVYCSERSQGVVVYRNARFMGIKQLYQGRPFDFMSDFIELEQADGKVIFLSRNSVIKFCEHGITPNTETISSRNRPE
jgi:hypothetical protein